MVFRYFTYYPACYSLAFFATREQTLLQTFLI